LQRYDKHDYFIHELTEQSVYTNPIVTQIESFTVFYEAEDYHQYYFAKNPDAGYCIYVVRPKVEKLKNIAINLDGF